MLIVIRGGLGTVIKGDEDAEGGAYGTSDKGEGGPEHGDGSVERESPGRRAGCGPAGRAGGRRGGIGCSS